MDLISRLKSELYKEYHFWTEQRLGWKALADPFAMPKYLLKRYLPSNPVIIDCGANSGADSIELARIFPRGVIHSIEAVPDISLLLKDNTKKYKNISCHELALSAVSGKAKMYISSGDSDASSSLLQPKDHLEDHPTVFFKNEVEVLTLTLDDWAERNEIPKVDFLWLDMQGGEFEMLRASKRIFDTVKVIHTEVSLKETYENVPLYSEFRLWFRERGFEVVKEAIPEGTDMGNVLFVRQ